MATTTKTETKSPTKTERIAQILTLIPQSNSFESAELAQELLTLLSPIVEQKKEERPAFVPRQYRIKKTSWGDYKVQYRGKLLGLFDWWYTLGKEIFRSSAQDAINDDMKLQKQFYNQSF